MDRSALPLYPLALGVLGAAMAVPVGFALATGDERSARAFLYGGAFTCFAALTLGVALGTVRRMPEAQGELMTLLVAWLTLPVFAAIPLLMLTPSLGWTGAWFEMVATFTTTGSTGYVDPTRVPPSVHLWRGVTAWLGGLLTLVAAWVVLAPRRLGGFSLATLRQGQSQDAGKQVNLVELASETVPVRERADRAIRAILPVYVALTLALVMLFAAAGDTGYAAAVHAMGVISTTAVSPHARGLAEVANPGVEIAAAAFLALVATRHVYTRGSRLGRLGTPGSDPERAMLAVLVLAATGVLFLRHWIAALVIDVPEEGLDAAEALWGAFFTTLSFLTTTGYQSTHWTSAREWSGLENPGLILLGLCSIGGGAATTAGGIKLIRAYTLLRHGLREIDRLAQPAVVAGLGPEVRTMIRDGAFVAWAFIMLYVAAILAVALALAVTGLSFETALLAAVAAVTNTGPGFGMVVSGHESFALLDPRQRAILGLGMVLGRIETLAVIAIFNPGALRSLVHAGKSAGAAKGKRTRSRM